ncbi:50S ribosomal protein L10 [bacterium]|nr:50S ribosomal protein L10 [bacterium]
MPNQKNIQAVRDLKEKILKAKSITFAEYHGLDVNKLNDLRSKIKDDEAEMLVTKNTLLKIALDEAKIKGAKEAAQDLKGPTAVIFSYSDALAPLKTIFEFAKTLELPKVKSAFIEGVYNNTAQVAILSQLPSREELLTKVVITLNSPISGFVNVLGGTQRKVVYALSAIAEKRGEV